MNKQLELYKKQLTVYQQDFIDAKYEISKMRFSEDDVKTFKTQKANANKLIKQIDQTRKDYEKWHKQQIEDDINLLKSWVTELTDIVRDKQIGYDEWYSELQVSRTVHAKEIFLELLPDYDLPFEPLNIWNHIFDTQFTNNLTDNKITKLITERLNTLLETVLLIDKKDYLLFEKSEFNIVKFKENQELLNSLDTEPDDEPLEHSSDTTKIVIRKVDLEKVKYLLSANGIWCTYE